MNEKSQVQNQKLKQKGKKSKKRGISGKEIPIPIATPRRDELLHLQYEVMIERNKWIRGECTYEAMRAKAQAFAEAVERRYRDKFDSKRGIKLKLHPAEIIAMPFFLMTDKG